MRIVWIDRGSRDSLPLGALLEELPPRLTSLGQHTVMSPTGGHRLSGRSSASRGRRIEFVPVAARSTESLSSTLQRFHAMTMVTLGKLEGDELTALAGLNAPWIAFQPWEADGDQLPDPAALTGCRGLVFTSEAAARGLLRAPETMEILAGVGAGAPTYGTADGGRQNAEERRQNSGNGGRARPLRDRDRRDACRTGGGQRNGGRDPTYKRLERRGWADPRAQGIPNRRGSWT